MNSKLNRVFHGLLVSHCIEKRYAVLASTGGRTESSKDMTDEEAMWFIREGVAKMGSKKLKVKNEDGEKRFKEIEGQKEQAKRDMLRKRILGVSYTMGWDIKRVKEWIEKNTKKRFNELSASELVVERKILEKIRSQQISKIEIVK